MVFSDSRLIATDSSGDQRIPTGENEGVFPYFPEDVWVQRSEQNMK